MTDMLRKSAESPAAAGHGHHIYPEEPHHHHTEVVPRWWQVAAGFGNLAAGAAQVATGAGVSGDVSWPVLGDGLHNLGDGLTTWTQASDVRNKARGGSTKPWRRKAAYWILATSSVYVAFEGVADAVQDKPTHTPNDWAVVATTAAVALNGGLYGSLKFKLHKAYKDGGAPNHEEQDLLTHTKIDAISAVGALAGAVGQRYNFTIGDIGIENWTAMGVGAFGAWHFRPTKDNLSGHNHGPRQPLLDTDFLS